MQYKNLVADVNKMVKQQVQRTYKENYQKIMAGDNEGLLEQLDQKRYVIEDRKAIQKAQGELIRNLRSQLHELKKDRDIIGLKKEMYVLKTELQDHKQGKKRLKGED